MRSDASWKWTPKVSTPPRPICGFCHKPAIAASYKHAYCEDHAAGPKTRGLIHP